MGMRWPWLTLAASGLVACTRPAATEPTAPIDIVDTNTPAFRDAPTPASQATKFTFERPEIPASSEIGCRFHTRSWKRAGYALNLYLGIGKPPWGRLREDADVGVSLTLDQGVGKARVTFEQAGVSLRSVVHRDEVRLRPRHARTLDGFAIPLPDRALPVETVLDGKARVHLFLGNDFANRAWTRATYRCDEITLERADFEPNVANETALGVGLVAEGSTTALRATPKGQPVATLAPSDPLWVDVIERGQDATRIRWEAANVLFFGWVDKGAVDETQSRGGLFGLMGVGEGGKEKPRRPTLTVRCRKALPLIVFQRGHARTVGTVGPQARFEPSVMFGDLRAIDIHGLEVTLRDGSFFTVASAIPKHCEAVAP